LIWSWVDQIDSHGLSTAQVSSMMDRIEYLQKRFRILDQPFKTMPQAKNNKASVFVFTNRDWQRLLETSLFRKDKKASPSSEEKCLCLICEAELRRGKKSVKTLWDHLKET
jgi:hypothetical protein